MSPPVFCTKKVRRRSASISNQERLGVCCLLLVRCGRFSYSRSSSSFAGPALVGGHAPPGRDGQTVRDHWGQADHVSSIRRGDSRSVPAFIGALDFGSCWFARLFFNSARENLYQLVNLCSVLHHRIFLPKNQDSPGALSRIFESRRNRKYETSVENQNSQSGHFIPYSNGRKRLALPQVRYHYGGTVEREVPPCSRPQQHVRRAPSRHALTQQIQAGKFAMGFHQVHSYRTCSICPVLRTSVRPLVPTSSPNQSTRIT